LLSDRKHTTQIRSTNHLVESKKWSRWGPCTSLVRGTKWLLCVGDNKEGGWVSYLWVMG